MENIFTELFSELTIAQIHQVDKVLALLRVCLLKLWSTFRCCSCRSLGKYLQEVTNLLLSTFSYLPIEPVLSITSTATLQ